MSDQAAPPAGNEPPATSQPAPPAQQQPPAVNPPSGEWTPPTREEVEAKDRAIAEANRRAKKLEAEAQKRADEEAAASGEYQQIAQREQERAQRLEEGIKASAVKAAIVEVAGNLRFRNPSLAASLISASDIEAVLGDDHTASVDAAGKAAIEQRLKEKLATDSYLAAEAPRAQLGGAGAAGGSAPAGGGNAEMNDLIRQGAKRGIVGGQS